MRPEDGARKQIEVYRRMTGKQRLRIGMELYELSRELVSANIRMMYPNISEEEFRIKLIARMTGRLDFSGDFAELAKRSPPNHPIAKIPLMHPKCTI